MKEITNFKTLQELMDYLSNNKVFRETFEVSESLEHALSAISIEQRIYGFSGSVELIILQCREMLKESSDYITVSMKKLISRLLKSLYTYMLLKREETDSTRKQLFRRTISQFSRLVLFSFKSPSYISKVTIS